MIRAMICLGIALFLGFSAYGLPHAPLLARRPIVFAMIVATFVLGMLIDNWQDERKREKND